MKAIGHLHGLRCAAAGSLRVDTLAIAAHNNHLRMLCQPLAERARRTGRQYIGHLAALQIHQYGAEALTLAPGPIIDSDNADPVR